MIPVKKPHTTEKSMKLSQSNLYTFVVDKNATKESIAKYIVEKFGVSVIGVKTINVKPKHKSQRTVRKTYLTGGFKKAIVSVKKGQKIAIFEAPKEDVVVTTGEGEPMVTERKDILRRTKVKIEKGSSEVRQTTQRKVITGK